MAIRDLTPGELPPPWKTGVPGRILRAQTSKEETEAQQLRAARGVVEELTDMDTIIYTDGSAEGGVVGPRRSGDKLLRCRSCGPPGGPRMAEELNPVDAV